MARGEAAVLARPNIFQKIGWVTLCEAGIIRDSDE